MSIQEKYDSFVEYTRELSALDAAESLLAWDQQTYMPPMGAESKSRQLATLSGIHHDMLVSDTMKRHLDELANGDLDKLGEDARVNVREMKRAYDHASRVPTKLVRDIARAQSLGMEAWAEAREKSDYKIFAPWLEKLLKLKCEQADAIGYEESRYDALHDEFEMGSTAKRITSVFAKLRDELVPLVDRIVNSDVAKAQKIPARDYPRAKQEALGRELLTAIGFDWKAGRIDVSAHPFCTGNLHDVRLTTRYNEKDLTQALFGLMHEGGHGLYEQGFDPAHQGTPRAQAVSLGIHESQSLMWENIVGRDRGFWKFAYPKLQKHFAPTFDSVSPEEWYKEINKVERSFIRVEADEVTYCLHVILRFELEVEMIEGRLPVKDIPEAWNAKMKDFLGITPKNDAEGCLQDIHWSHGIFGYFPTYALGYLYSAQFYNQAKKDLPGVEDDYAKGEFGRLLGWLRKNIHQRGMTYAPHDLVKVVTGEELDTKYLIDYLTKKYTPIYEL